MVKEHICKGVLYLLTISKYKYRIPPFKSFNRQNKIQVVSVLFLTVDSSFSKTFPNIRVSIKLRQ